MERNFLFDQNIGKLRLSFADNHSLSFTVQVLGSFDPHERTFLWAWDNPSIVANWRREIQAVRRCWRQEPSFTEPKHVIWFDRLTPLLALACKTMGADGVYRCAGDNTSLFLAIWLEAANVPNSDTVHQGQILLHDAGDLISAYDGEMFPIDQRYEAEQESVLTSIEAMLAEKTAVHCRYWQAKDDRWLPGSFSWPSDHDPVERQLRFAVPDHEGGALCVTLRQHEHDVHRIRQVNDDLKIVDQLLEWGNGFIWPKHVAQ